MPKDSDEYEYYSILSGDCEAFAYNNFGGIAECKALAIYNLIGWDDMANDVKDRTSVTTRHAANDGDALVHESAKSVLQKVKNDS